MNRDLRYKDELEECYSQTLKKIENIKVIDILVYIFSRKV
jgi:hypothetical protein